MLSLALKLQRKPSALKAFIKFYADETKDPMVWVNPLGQKALQVHGIAVRKMFLKATPTSEAKVVEDVVEIRKLLHSWQERVIRPEYVLMAPVEEGDVQIWDNWVGSSILMSGDLC